MKLLLFALIIPLIKSDLATDKVYHGPAQARELFSHAEKLYYFYSDRVSWDEASAICEANGMHLTHLDQPAKAKFAAESIAEAWMTFEDMWIGAKKDTRGRWQWIYTKTYIAEESSLVAGNYSFHYPPWVENEAPARDGKDCLAIDRNGHNDPYFVDLQCTVPRPFICEQNFRNNNTDPSEGTVVRIDDFEFLLFHARLTWIQAVSYCRQQGLSLATIENMTIARILAKGMLKARPEFEDAWIGANYKDDAWLWVETGEELKQIPGSKGDGNGSRNALVPEFPPWFENKLSQGRYCVIFDRHLCDDPSFITLKCNRQRDFICIRRRQIEDGTEPVEIIRGQYRYIFYSVHATWDEGRKICESEGDDTYMLILHSMDETKFVMQAMADAKNPMDHVWLGGKFDNDRWMWVQTNEEIKWVVDSDGFPPWCDNETTVEMACLNLDRQNHLTPLLYGLECNSTQGVVCVQEIALTDRILDYPVESHNTMSGVVSSSITTRVTKLVDHPISPDEARKYCRREVGTIWTPRFDQNETVPGIEKLAKILAEAQNNITEVYHTGLRYEKEKGWHFINEKGKNVYVSVPSEIAALTGDDGCLVGEVSSSAETWKWSSVKCQDKLNSQIICIPVCSVNDLPYQKNHEEWTCDMPPSYIFDHKMIGMGCTHKCNSSQALRGPDRFFCSKNGWNTYQSGVKASGAVCLNKDDALKFVAERATKNVLQLGFIIDSSASRITDYKTTKYMIAHLIQYYRTKASPDLKVVIVSMEPNNEEFAVVKLNKHVRHSNCTVIGKEVGDLYDTGEGFRDFGAALMKMKDVLTPTHANETIIVFITPDQNQKGTFKDIARELRNTATIIAIGISSHATVLQLNELATNGMNYSLALSFKTSNDAIVAVQTIVETCKNCTCKFDYFLNDEEHTSTTAPATVNSGTTVESGE